MINTTFSMTKIISGKIEKGKIIPSERLSGQTENTHIRIFIFPQVKNNINYFGKGKGIFGDGLKFQKKIRQEWQ